MKHNNKVHNTKISCICCNKLLKPIYKKEQTEISAENGMWEKSSVNMMSCTFGSAFDGDVFLIGICDSCLSKAIKQNQIIHCYNYLESM